MRDKNIIFVSMSTFVRLDDENSNAIEEIATLAIKMNDKTYYFERNDYNIGEAISNNPELIKKLLLFGQEQNTILFNNEANNIIYRRDTYYDISKELFKIINKEIELNGKVYIFGDLKSEEQTLFEEILLADWKNQVFCMSASKPEIIKNLNCHEPIFITMESIKFLFRNLKVNMSNFLNSIENTFDTFKDSKNNDIVIVNTIKNICELLF